VAVDPRWRENQRVAQAAAGSANELVPALADIVRSGHWEEFTHPMRGVQRFGSFPAYCTRFLGLSAQAVEALLERSQFKDDARTVRRLLREDVPPVAGQGRPRKGSDATFSAVGDARDSEYVLARLKRDRPDLAALVVAGDLTPNAAAVAAGIRRPYLRVRADDPARAVAALLRHYTRAQLLAALAAAAEDG